VDPDLDRVRIYRRGLNRFHGPLELFAESGDVLTTPLLPGLTLALTEIFEA
jgi:Uma2 family endonuclease